jgi:hypothetical protein
MGFLSRAASAMGHVDKGLLKDGLLGRGHVTGCRRTAVSTGNQVQSVVCNLTVDVELEDRPVYTATCKHPIQIPYLPQFESGQGFVAVRVDPEDQSRIALDLTHEVPPARDGTTDAQMDPTTLGAVQSTDGPVPNRDSPVKAAEILATGTPCRAIIQTSQPLGIKKDGHDVWGLVLNATFDDGQPPIQARTGVAIPAEAMALVFPGAILPAKRRADVLDGVAIDWEAALAEKR